jgi:ketosteroid isomerase-like protein
MSETSADVVTFPDVVEGIGATLAAHAQAQDDGRTDDIAGVYCLDGALEVPGMGSFEGRDAVRQAFAGWAPTAPQRHMVTNTVVTDWSELEASAISDVVFVQKGDSGWAVQVAAKYHDRFRNDNGTWRILHRTMQFTT